MTHITTIDDLRNRFGLSLPLLVGLFVYAKVLVLGGSVIGDGDTYWHIAAGRWIIEHRAVPQYDMFSFSTPGAPWLTLEWLAEVVLAWVYDHLGWTGIVTATALSVAAALAMLLRALLRALAPVPALIATMLACLIALTHLLARPHILTLPILVAWVAGLVAARSEDRAPSIWLVPLMTLWANFHGSYMLGLVLAALIAGEAVLLAPDQQARLHAVRAWGLFGALCVAAALVTPLGFDGLLRPFRALEITYASALIGEEASPNFQKMQPLELWIMLLLSAALSFGWRLPPTRVGIVLLMLHMALQHFRHGELFGFIAPLLLASALATQLRGNHQPIGTIDRRLAEFAKPASAKGIASAGVLLLALSAAVLRGAPPEPAVKTPAAALAAVAARGIKGPVLNDYEFGGYLIFRGIQPFIDGRADSFYHDAFIRRYFEATGGLSDWLPNLLRDYGITWTLLIPGSPANVLLDQLPGWKRFYADDVAVIYLRDETTEH
jgi:hypothetical protein